MRSGIEGGYKTGVSRPTASYRIGCGRRVRFKDIHIEARGRTLAVIASGVAVMLPQEVCAADSVRETELVDVEVGRSRVNELAAVRVRGRAI